MGKKRKRQREQGNEPAAAVPPAPPAEEPRPLIRWRLLFDEAIHQPALVGAWFATVVTLFAIYGAVRFADDMSMGAVREPTGMIFCAAIAFTLFASYWRQSRRAGDDRAGG